MLEIYEPMDADTVFARFDTQSPIMSIAKGDIVNPGTWPGSQSPIKVLQVCSVEHILWCNGETVAHKICVFTKELENTRELRFAD